MTFTTMYEDMKQYIDKSALVAEMNKLKNISLEYGYTTEQRVIINVGKDLTLRRLLDYIDTLEIKEVDLEKELNEYGYHYDYVSLASRKELVDIAKHFFELGMRVNNPITAQDRGTADEIILSLRQVENDYRIDHTKEIEWVRNKVQKGE